MHEWWWSTLSEKKWIHGGDGVLVHWRVHIDAIDGIVCEGKDGGHGVLLYDVQWRYYKVIGKWIDMEAMQLYCIITEVLPQQNICYIDYVNWMHKKGKYLHNYFNQTMLYRSAK